MARLLLFAAFLITIIACKSPESNKDSESTAPAVSERIDTLFAGRFYTERTTAISQRSYALYVPKNYTPEKKWPLLLFLDPHADSKDPFTNYQSLADRFGLLLMISLDAKNGISLAESGAIVSDLLREANSVLPVLSSNIFIVGFSGGAKAALSAAASSPGLAGVIYCGAAFPPNSLPVKIPSLAMTGLKDMNFSEVLYYTSALDTVPYRHSILVSGSDHRWPSAKEFEPAVLWCLATRCRAVAECDAEAMKELSGILWQSIEKENDPVMKDFKLRHFIACTDGIIPENNAMKLLLDNKNSLRFQQRLQQFTDELAYEQQVKQELQAAFQEKDMTWWNNRIRLLRASNSTTNQRLLGYISLGAYLYSRNAIDQLKTDLAAYYIDIYKAADPENPEWAFLSACRSAQLGDKSAAIKWLQTAVRLGLDDADKLTQEKCFQGMQQDPGFRSLLAAIEK